MPTQPPFGVTLFVQDVEKNLEYFTRTLGFREVERFESPDGQVAHALVAFGKGANSIGIGLGSIPGMDQMDYDFAEFGENIRNSPQTLGNGVLLYFRVPNVDKFHQKILANGAIIDEPPTDQTWGERTISVLTPDGYYLAFWQAIKGFQAPEEAGRVVRKGGKTATRTARTTRGTTRGTTRRASATTRKSRR